MSGQKKGYLSPALSDQHREIQHIIWEWQQDSGLDIPVEAILCEEVNLKLQEAEKQASLLQAMLAWHREPVDWPALIQRHRDGMRYFQEQYLAQMARQNTQEIEQNQRGNDEVQELSPLTKKYRIDPEQSPSELDEARDRVGEAADPTPAALLKPREKDKVDRLNEEISADMRGLSSHPHAFAIMLSSPEFLTLHGWYRFEGRLAHVIHDSYTYFHQLALSYIRRSLSACHYQLQIAGFKIAENNRVEALAIIEKTMSLIYGLYPNETLAYICDLTHLQEPEIQVKRRHDLIQIAKFHIHHALYKGELLRGLVLNLMGQVDQSSESFERCYRYVGVLEDILKSPQHTETLRLLKDKHQDLKISNLHKIVREYEQNVQKT